MWNKAEYRLLARAAQITRGLRFRLTLSYVLFFSILLIGIGWFIRQGLLAIFDSQMRDTLEEEWGAAKGYLRIEQQRPIWFADPTDPEEAFIVSRLQHVYLLTDAAANVLQVSDTYESLGVDTPAEIAAVLKSSQPVYRIRTNQQHVPYMIRCGVLPDDKGRRYFLAIGRTLAPSRETLRRFTVNYFLLMPVLVVITGLFGWFLAGRALEPVNSVSRTAQRITSANLHVQIPPRGAGDELDRLIGAFNSMIERLQLSFEQIRQFSTDVSHELRTPLTGIRGQIEVALLSARTPEQFREAMENALQDVEQLSSIVRALLLLSQAESGQLALEMTPLDLAQVARDVADQFQIPAEADGVTLSTRLESGCVVRGDRVQIERMISNLLSNAVKYTPAGGAVTVRLSETDGWARLVVEDTGIGIPEDHLPHIFDRFYRVRNPRGRSIQGLGLGLSFVAWIVKAHQGTIEVESQEGKGSRFTVSLPLKQKPGTDGPVPKQLSRTAP